MDSKYLKSFITVAELNSITQAAKQQFITQPAMSKRIQALEQEFNCQLFTRKNRQLHLTCEGKLLLKKAYTILAEIENSKKQINNLKSTIGGQLPLATSHHIGLHRLPPLLKQYKAKYPNVDIRLHFLESELAFDYLRNGKAECALITLSGNIPNDFIYQELWQDDLYLTYSKRHSLATHKNVSIQKLSQHSSILPSSNSYTRELIDNYFYQQKLTISVAMESNYLETIKMMVDVGLGWSFLPESLISKDWIKVKLNKQFYRKLGIITLKNNSLSNAANAFWNLRNL